MKLLDSNLDNNSLVEMEFVCKKMFVVDDTWKNKAKVYNKDAHNNDTFDGLIGFIDNKKWTKSTTMDIMTKRVA